MKTQAELLAYKKDGRTLCHTSAGYSQHTSIELNDYVEVATIDGMLPLSDEIFPKGAPVTDPVKVGNKILKRKQNAR
jgi:hypothetical protein